MLFWLSFLPLALHTIESGSRFDAALPKTKQPSRGEHRQPFKIIV